MMCRKSKKEYLEKIRWRHQHISKRGKGEILKRPDLKPIYGAEVLGVVCFKVDLAGNRSDVFKPIKGGSADLVAA